MIRIASSTVKRSTKNVRGYRVESKWDNSKDFRKELTLDGKQKDLIKSTGKQEDRREFKGLKA